MKLGPRNCISNVSMNDFMDSFDDIQIEETLGFDFAEQDLSELIEENTNFNMKDYLNGNYDY